MSKRKAFTLLEVLISIALLSIVLLALYKGVDMLRTSNRHLFEYLEKSKKVTKAIKVFYLDMLSSNGDIKITKDEFARICIEQTKNSLYDLPSAKVCWVVDKNQNTLVRVEGNNYTLPLNSQDRVEVDSVMKDIELFDIYHQKDKILVLLQQQSKEPISFMVQGISKPEKKKKKKQR